ncbi:MAG: ADP-ribosylglycohydrolase family protein [Clostridia bacterium]|nr:ADP-ribosylglycohydrolase family protein [Clostridia bacterium]
MFGAIYGDIIGSYYETHCTKDYNFEFQKDSTFTDDTVLTVAVCKAILNNSDPIARWEIRKRGLEYAGQFRQYYSYYPYAGFGNMFSEWARCDSFKVNHSYANGAAMRAVPIGYAYDNVEQILFQAKASCYYTHNNSEAIKAAQAVAIAVFLARNRKSKNDIREFLENKFHYDLSRKIKDIKSNYVFNSRASYSVPPAIIAFLDSTDYESAIRNAISLGGDADTEACIAGGIAEAFYRETPKHIVDFCDRKIDSTLKNVAFDFKKHFCK